MSAHLHFELPLALVINANHREHHHARANRVRNLRALGAKAARGLSVDGPCTLTVNVGWSRAGKHDAPNLSPTSKALTDGAVDAGLISDDSDAHIVSTTFTGYVARKPGITVIDLVFCEVA